MTAAPAKRDRPDPDLSEDALIGGRVRLFQPGKGYRAAIDPVLLAAAVPAAAGETVLDVGSGTGAAALCLARRVAGVRVTGIEVEAEMVRLARLSAEANGLDVAFVEGDLLRPPAALAPASFDHVMANPPYGRPGRCRPPADAGKARAGVEGEAGLADWVRFCLAMVAPKGTVTMIHRADRLDQILALLHGRLGGIVVLPLWPGPAGKPAKRVIVGGRAGSATPLRLCPGLVLHGEQGAYTAEAEAVLREGRALSP